jgi:hypothetical protein
MFISKKNIWYEVSTKILTLSNNFCEQLDNAYYGIKNVTD